MLDRVKRALRSSRPARTFSLRPTASTPGARAADALRGLSPVPGPPTKMSDGFKRSRAIRVAILLVLASALSALYPYSRDRSPTTVNVGQVWADPDVAAPFNFPVLKNPEEITAQQAQARSAVAPVIRADTTARAVRKRVLDGYFNGIDSLLTLQRQFADAAVHAPLPAAPAAAPTPTASPSPADAAVLDTVGFARLQIEIQPPLSVAELQRLLQGGVAPTASPLRAIQTRLEPILLDLAQQGILDRPKRELVGPGDVLSLRLSPTEERVVPTATVLDPDEALAAVHTRLGRPAGLDSGLVAIGEQLAAHLLAPTLYVDLAATTESQETAAQRVSEKRGLVREGQIIVRKGDVVSAETQRQLRSLYRATAERAGLTGLARLIAGRFLLTVLILSTFFIYLYTFRPALFSDNAILLLMALLFLGVALITALTVHFDAISPFVIPVALVSITLTILFDSRVGFYGTIAAAMLVAALRGNDFSLFVASAFAGILAVFTVRDIKQRSQLFVSVAVVFAGYAFALVSLSLIRDGTWVQLRTDLLYALGNAALTFLFYPLLYLFERAFGISTDLTLVELTSLRHPLLQALQARAPGSFHHSLQVANLAEAAVEAVGGNSLLARVGAYFHDVGKMVKPEYFVENQMGAVNKHDRLTPSMSCLVIVSHVKNGEVLADQHHLPKRVVDFIQTHHGTSLMSYFYAKAQQQAGGQKLPEADFRYPGPRPCTREQGIVMLADGVEAAGKSLTTPTPERIEGMIDAIIEARLEEGQLDDCDLTLKDLSRIKSSFLNVLVGVYHSRIKYPGQEKIEGPEGAMVPVEDRRPGGDLADEPVPAAAAIDPNAIVPYPPDRRRRTTFAQAAARGSHQSERSHRRPWEIEEDDEPFDDAADALIPADTHLPSHAAELRLEQAGLVRAFDPKGVADLAVPRPVAAPTPAPVPPVESTPAPEPSKPKRRGRSIRAAVGFVPGRSSRTKKP